MTTLILSVFFSISASADVVEVDGIYYDISETTATVTDGDNEYSGDIVIPESITYENSKYSVTSIGECAFASCFSLTSITYNGTQSQWNKISKASSWKNNSAIKTITCTDGVITL